VQFRKIILTFFIFFIPLLAEAKVIQTNSFADILTEIDEDTWVFCDIDDTLLTTTTTLGNSLWWDYFINKMEKARFSLDQVQSEVNHLIGTILKKAPVTLVEKNTASVVAEMQNKGVKVFGLTARKNHPAYLPEFDLVTFQDLNAQGIVFNELPVEATEKLNKYFSYGTIYTSHNLKGPYLKDFFEQVGAQPKKVVFIDDSISQVDSVIQTMASLNIPVAVFHYTFIENNGPRFNPYIANIQLENLIKTGSVISDDEALDIALANPKTDKHYFLKKLVKKWRKQIKK
jgi:hypothetical protein